MAVTQAIRLGSAMRNCAELQKHLVSIMTLKEIANLFFGTSGEDSSGMTWPVHVQSLRTLQELLRPR